jgi:hypothetical protein
MASRTYILTIPLHKALKSVHRWSVSMLVRSRQSKAVKVCACVLRSWYIGAQRFATIVVAPYLAVACRFKDLSLEGRFVVVT